MTALLSSVQIEHGLHDRVVVFNRGASAGRLVLTRGDGDKLASLVDALGVVHAAMAKHKKAEAAYVRHRDDPVPRAVPERVVDDREEAREQRADALRALECVLEAIT